MSRRLRFIFALSLTVLSLLTVGFSFWLQDWRYSLPTPRPVGFRQVPLGSAIHLSTVLAHYKRPHRPLLLHFLSVRCACSQFNLDHFRSLAQHFGLKVDFVTVLQTQSPFPKAESEYSALHLAMPMVPDPDGQIGFALGVYSTPQAVLLDGENQLYFRGNYNVSRYCNDERTEFARLALSALLDERPLPHLPPQAFIAYGCPLLRHRTGPDKTSL